MRGVPEVCVDRRTGEAFRRPPKSPLTIRQGQVLAGLADGCTNARIGSRLGLSESAVRAHLVQVFRKLGAQSRANAVHLAHRAGWLS